MVAMDDPFEALRNCKVEDLPRELARLGFAIEERQARSFSAEIRLTCSVRVSKGSRQWQAIGASYLDALRRATDRLLEGA